MLPVLIAAAALYLTGLAPEPAYGSGSWWLLRLPWLLLLAVLLVGVVLLLQPLERVLARAGTTLRPDGAVRWPLLLWLGLAASVAALSRFAVQGFAHGGRFPQLPALGLALGIALVASSGAGRERTLSVPAESGTPQATAASRIR